MKEMYIAPELDVRIFMPTEKIAHIPGFDLDDLVNGDDIMSAGNGEVETGDVRKDPAE